MEADIRGDGAPVDHIASYIVSLNTVSEGGANLELLSSTPAMVVLNGSKSPHSMERENMEWTDKDIIDFNNNDDFGVFNASKMRDLGLKQEPVKKKRLHLARSYEMICHFHIVWSAI